MLILLLSTLKQKRVSKDKTTERAKRVLILGCGWIGFPLAQRLITLGYEVYGTTTSSEKLNLFQENGIKPICIQVGTEEPELLNELRKITPEKLIISYPLGSRRMKGDEYKVHTRWIQENLKFDSLEQVILTSSTSVYPDGFGQVDETCLEKPDGAGLIQLNYEDELRTIFREKLVILRLAGLIGPGRHPGRFLAGKTNVPNPDVPVNLVHLDDVIGLLLLLVKQKYRNDLFNVCFPLHPTRKEYYTKMALEIDMHAPVFDQKVTSQGKIVLSNKSCTILQFEYKNPIF